MKRSGAAGPAPQEAHGSGRPAVAPHRKLGSNPAPFAIGDVGHVRAGHRGSGDLNGAVGLLAALDAIQEILLVQFGAVVVRHLGDFPNPEDLAFARPAAVRPLYHVRFDPKPFWPEGVAPEELVIEIFEHWLEAAP